MEQPSFQPEITSDDKLWALLAYIFSPLIPIVILLMADKKDRPFLKAHNMQALVLGVVGVVLGTIISAITVGIGGCIFFPVYFIYVIVLALKANKGETFEIPVITNFVKNQGW